MYVCICQAVTSSAISAALDGGATSLEELQSELGVASGCGGCADHVMRLLAERALRRPLPVVESPVPLGAG